ncbi:site-specific integrase [Endozoicomonas gorgoniicola]|uniref:Site-specific integrase n=1 Tax=Endozoicomonas gorgoniicola TaxID=1234144 RepID=A0ABT3MYU0_9GAMM|nr:site-specific integrase [Endozoicomonas gorgoniicola]MCW7554529.1 site-specific integrase [Endozoicomonas gorgoniicola]
MKKLYKLIEDVQYPKIINFNLTTDEIIVGQEISQGFFSFLWPNGVPCIFVEMFLIDKSEEVKISKSDGGTVGVYASQITHLVRFCYSESKEFWELTTFDIDKFVSVLANEKDETGNNRRRNNNTIKSILSSVVIFLKWLQSNYFPNKNIIGIDTFEKRHQIKLREGRRITEKGHAVLYQYFPTKLPSSTRCPKKPVSETVIKLLWDTLAENKAYAKVNRRLQSFFSIEEQKDHIEYMHKRRELQLTLLAATGMRPQELINICVTNNRPHLEKGNILVPTLKRKKFVRLIPMDRATIIRIEVFIDIHRKKLIERLVRYGILSCAEHADDVIYLNSETGKKVKPDAAYQEFFRLTKKAGISQKNCQSMFRHRFITNMVKLHLVSFMDKNPLKSRQIMTDSDYRTILTKIAKFTGHKDVNSLFHYIDLAWDELDVFEHAFDIQNVQNKLKSVLYLVSSLKADLEIKKDAPKKHIISFVQEQLEEIENAAMLTG